MRRLRCWVLCGLAWMVAPAWALDGLRLDIGDLQGRGLGARGITATLRLDPEHPVAVLRIERLTLPAPVGELRGLRLQCSRSELGSELVACRGGRLEVDGGAVSARAAVVDLSYRRRTRRLEFSIRDLGVAAGRLDVAGSWQQGAGVFRVDGRGLDAGALTARLPELLPPDAELAGRLDVQAHLTSRADALRGYWQVSATGLQMTAADGAVATEGLALDVRGNLRRNGDGWDFDATLESGAGQAYAEPVFLDTGRRPLRLAAVGHWSPRRLVLDHWRLQQPEVADAAGRLAYRFGEGHGLELLEIDLARAFLAEFYPIYLQPFLIGTTLDELRTRGAVAGRLRVDAAGLETARLRVDDLSFDDRRGRYALNGLAGRLSWHRSGDPAVSRLAWRGGSLYSAELGAAAIDLILVGDRVSLRAPVRVPILDGALAIGSFSIDAVGDDAMLSFDATLEPISLGRLTQALGWPSLRGSLSGRIPWLSYRQQRLAVAGQLEVRAFDGEIRADNLVLEDPFGTVPRLSSDVTLRGLDLRRLTETFSFGRIDGRLDGDIRNLRLVGWQPAAFDARLYTPPGDRSRRRISQRAIDNLSSIGGAGAVLSRSFLRVFEDFAYQSIGLGCRLQEDVCRMSGIAPAPSGGYYLVRGRGLPRIDVVGHQREVSWPTLLEQIRTATQSEGPVVR